MNCMTKRFLAMVIAMMLLLTGVVVASADSTINVSPVIEASGLTYPTNLSSGESFSLRGTLTVNAGTITKVTATITNRNTKKTVLSASVSPKTKTVDIRSTINKKVTFGKLAAGNYTLKIVATAKCGSKTASKTVVKHGFTVEGNKPKLSITGAVYPSVMKAGNKTPIRGVINTSAGTITEVTAYVLDSNGGVKMKSSRKPNKSFFNLQYTINNDLTFGLLKPGTYTYKLVAKAKNGKYTTSTTLINKAFTVE